MDLKEYWAKDIPQVNHPPKHKPVKCSCGKCFVDENAWKQHMRRFGKKEHIVTRYEQVITPKFGDNNEI